MKTLKVLSALGIIALLFAGCTGKDGAAGPQGAAGANGVANISSAIYTIPPGSWSATSGGYNDVISDAAISNANTDGVEVFMSPYSNGPWFGLPCNNLIVSSDQMQYAYANGAITPLYVYSSAPSSTLYMKVVVIPPAAMKQHPNTNWKDWSQVSAILETQKITNN